MGGPKAPPHRKSRWESGNNPPADHKTDPGDSKPSSVPSSSSSKSKHKPSDASLANKKGSNDPDPNPKSNPSPTPSQPKPPSDRAPPPGVSLPFPDFLGRPPPPPAYGFHMLERRSIMLADGSVRSYFALPPDYQDPRPMLSHRPEFPGSGLGFDRRFPPGGPLSPDFRAEFRGHEDHYMRSRNQDHWNSHGFDGRGGGPLSRQPPENFLKRKLGDEGEKQRQQLLQYGNSSEYKNEKGEAMTGTSSLYTSKTDEMRAPKIMRTNGGYENFQGSEVDQRALKKAFLHFLKLLNDNVNQRKNYLADGKKGPIQCIVCGSTGRSSKDFPDMHGLIMHSYYSDSSDLHVDHLGLHKSACVLMGWNYLMPPDNSKAYQVLSANEAAANQDDLIMWPPTVIIHNTDTGKSRDGRMEGLGNKAMDGKLRDLGFGGGKAKSLYGREGHLGITLAKFAGDQLGLKEAVRLAEFFEKNNCGRKAWDRVHSTISGKDGENNPNLVKVDEKTGEKQRIFYGYLGTVSDLDKVDFETRKKTAIESKREIMLS